MINRIRKGLKRRTRESCLAMLKFLEGNDYFPVESAGSRKCPICGYDGEFKPFGAYYIRPDSICTNCGSYERHRLFRIWFDVNKHKFEDSKILHFAPEKSIKRFLQESCKNYHSADLFRKDVDFKWNIESIDAKDDSFDIVVCSHVLEHVDAEAALSEIHRVLKPRGFAIIMIPICEGLEVTYENSSAALGSDADRRKHFQQFDHVRVFGRDFREKIVNARFQLEEFCATGMQAAQYGLVLGERIFILKPSTSH